MVAFGPVQVHLERKHRDRVECALCAVAAVEASSPYGEDQLGRGIRPYRREGLAGSEREEPSAAACSLGFVDVERHSAYLVGLGRDLEAQMLGPGMVLDLAGCHSMICSDDAGLNSSDLKKSGRSLLGVACALVVHWYGQYRQALNR